jgi:hypothetical protein
LSFCGGDYEEFRLLGYKIPVRTSQETHYFSAAEPSRLILCKISGFRGGNYGECRLLGYGIPVFTSQETHYIPFTESYRLCYVRLEILAAVTKKNAVFWDVTWCDRCKNQCFVGTHHLHHQGDKNRRARNNVGSN